MLQLLLLVLAPGNQPMQLIVLIQHIRMPVVFLQVAYLNVRRVYQQRPVMVEQLIIIATLVRLHVSVQADKFYVLGLVKSHSPILPAQLKTERLILALERVALAKLGTQIVLVPAN